MDNEEMKIEIDDKELKKQIIENGHYVRCEILIESPSYGEATQSILPYVAFEHHHSSIAAEYVLYSTLKSIIQDMQERNKEAFYLLEKFMGIRTVNLGNKIKSFDDEE